jgi:hypothetical protein
MGGGFSGPRGFSGARTAAPFRMGTLRPAPFGRSGSFGARSAPLGRVGFGGRNAPFSRPFNPGRGFFPNRRFFFGASPFLYGGYPYGYVPPFSVYPLFGPDNSYAPAEQGQVAPEEGEGDALSSQVQGLSDEVGQLEQEQAWRQFSPARAAAQPAQERPMATVFVYRDGHQFEAQNYAIQGKTLWVFGDQTTRKIPLADLDLAESKKLNDARGVDFTLPEGAAATD